MVNQFGSLVPPGYPADWETNFEDLGIVFARERSQSCNAFYLANGADRAEVVEFLRQVDTSR